MKAIIKPIIAIAVEGSEFVEWVAACDAVSIVGVGLTSGVTIDGIVDRVEGVARAD
jgi:hypothetical protein